MKKSIILLSLLLSSSSMFASDSSHRHWTRKVQGFFNNLFTPYQCRNGLPSLNPHSQNESQPKTPKKVRTRVPSYVETADRNQISLQKIKGHHYLVIGEGSYKIPFEDLKYFQNLLPESTEQGARSFMFVPRRLKSLNDCKNLALECVFAPSGKLNYRTPSRKTSK